SRSSPTWGPSRVPSPTPSPSPPKPTSDAPRTARAALIAAAVLVAGGLAVWLALPAPSLPVLGAVPSFTLVERSGRAVSAADLAGHVWVADFVFTHCPTFCPLLTERMAGLQKALAPAADPVRLVSFSVDPVHDTPEVLLDYARRAGAGDGWLFVTGPRKALAALLRDGLKVAWADDGPPPSRSGRPASRARAGRGPSTSRSSARTRCSQP